MFGLRGLRPDLEISGFETAFAEIAPRLAARGHRITIYCRAGAHSPPRRVAREDDIELLYMPSPGGKNLSALSATTLGVMHAQATRTFDLWFFVNVGMGHHAALARLAGHPVVINVDGLDWRRGKWGPLARAYFRSAAGSATRFATAVITDAAAMQEFYRSEMNCETEMIAYGAEVSGSTTPERLEALGLTPRGYYLIVSRLIPENSLDMMLEGFTRSRVMRPLVVVGGATYEDDFHARLRAIAAADPRIRLVGHMNDQWLLRELWCNCVAYLHGHTVGGTNPALLRAMGHGSCVLARDTAFNREVLGEAGAFFSTVEDVTSRVQEVDGEGAYVERLRDLAVERVRESYTWERVVDAYERLFLRVAGR